MSHSHEKGNPDYFPPPWEKERRYVGDKPKVERTKDYSSMTSGRGWPFERDNIDYNPEFDEDRSDHIEGEK